MTLKWLILRGVVKAIFVVAPFADVSGDFNLGDMLEEAKEFSAAGSTKAMLFTSPILLLLQTLYEASQVCHAGGNVVGIVLSVFALAVVLYGCYKIPTRLFRGACAPFFWFGGLTLLEIVFEIYLLMPIAKLICA